MSTDTDPYDLERFVRAQDAGDTYGAALAELAHGRKESHWMWFVFPQVAGLGRSDTARRFAISGLDEARAYLVHPVLGPRLRESVDAVLAITGSSAEEVFGGIDATKLRSSMTLFLRAAPDEERFSDVLHRHFGGQADDATDERLATG
jgi:uncharacterized protein (DUF1810 family)